MIHNNRRRFAGLLIAASLLVFLALWVLLFARLSDLVPVAGLEENTVEVVLGAIFLAGLFTSMGLGIWVAKRLLRAGRRQSPP